MKIFALSLISLLIAIHTAFAQPATIDKLRSDSKVPGLQFVWIDKDKTTNYSLGTAYTGGKQGLNANTIFQAASLSKVVLAYVCLQLVAEKKIALDTPLYCYFDYPRIKNDPNSKKITARMVLNHTTGWPNWAQNPMQKGWSTSALKTQFEPGTKWNYSGEGFVFLQLVIQNILKKDFQQIAKERVFTPLEMKNSSFIWEERFAKTATFGYNGKNEITERGEFFLPNAAFSLLTTATDYSLFLKALLKQHLSTMLTDEVPTNTKQIFWGLGIGIQKNEIGKFAWHWGDNGDYKAFFIINPEKEQIMVCFTNSINGLKLMKPLANSYFGNASWYDANGL
ncbi:serine hydrolase domain-containing protein [Pedobacter sp. Du54]|uniref:serine hydrolase domain-containing protein n=1 Tax=Pedobacter anseongensis TaxID=3133439 RepID=UPI0030A5C2AD